MNQDSFETFETAVHELWPTCRASVRPMWDGFVSRYSTDEVCSALKAHRQCDYDSVKPNWKMFYAILAGSRQHAIKSQLQITLDSVRHALDGAGHGAYARRLTDEEVFLNFLDAQTVNDRRLPVTGEARPDPDGAFAKCAAVIRWAIAERLASELRERGQTVPVWLEPGDEPYRKPVDSPLFRKWFPRRAAALAEQG